MTLDEILARLDGVRRSGCGWMARCPAHFDRRASLSLTDRGDRTLIFCFAGCTTDEVMSALGLTMRDLFADDGRRGRALPAGASRADIRQALAVEQTVLLVSAADRRAGRQISTTDAERERVAHRRIAAGGRA